MYRERLKKQSDSAASSGRLPTNWRGSAVPILMLLIGLSIGYISRPAIEARFQGKKVTEVTATQDMVALAAELQARTRHYLGSADAPVTLIEFGDFH